MMDTLNTTGKYHFLSFFLIILLLAPGYSLAAVLAGNIKDVRGTAWAQTGDEPARKLEKGSPVYEKDVIRTESESSVEILFKDDTRFLLGTDTEMSISEFIYGDTERENSFSTRILKGTFRFITGLLAKNKPDAMEVNTSVATIGIRGTHVGGQADATSSTIILLEPENGTPGTSIQVSNTFGSVTIDEPGYGTEIPDEFSPPSPPRRMRMQTINNIMRSIQSIQRINTPRPRAGPY
ncbi:MAG TPA: FecR family protein [Gammaproteobacteria bacterium]|nr:FecR family protein [Gammaproteobacteria bacterium]